MTRQDEADECTHMRIGKNQYDVAVNVLLKTTSRIAKAVYVRHNDPRSVLSDIDFALFLKNIRPLQIVRVMRRVSQQLRSELRGAIFVRWSTTSLFEPIDHIRSNRNPIVLDFLVHGFGKNSEVSQLGFEAGILESLIQRAELIQGKRQRLLEPSVSNSEFLCILRHYFQNNISQLVKLGSNPYSPFFVILNSQKVASLALYKFINISNRLYGKNLDLDKKSALQSVSSRFPHLRRDCTLIGDLSNERILSANIEQALQIYESVFRLVISLSEFAVKAGHSFGA